MYITGALVAFHHEVYTEIRLEYVHRGQTYLTASHSQLRYFFKISRRDGENNGFLAGVPLLRPPSRVSRPNSIPLPFRTPATQAKLFGGTREQDQFKFGNRGTKTKIVAP